MTDVDRCAYIGLGSNLQDPAYQVMTAFDALADLPGTVLQGTSSLYRSKPVGPTDQPDFVNAAAQLDTELSAEDLLDAFQQIEVRQGRVRGPRWGPRTIDLDLLLYGTKVIKTPHLTVPHPRIAERAFVLLPLLDLDPGVVIPGLGPGADLLAAVSCDNVRRIQARDGGG